MFYPCFLSSSVISTFYPLPSTFHIQLSIFNFQFSTFNLQFSKLQPLPFVLEVIVVEHTHQRGYLLHGMGCVGANVLFLQP